jgi:hypothetical protein
MLATQVGRSACGIQLVYIVYGYYQIHLAAFCVLSVCDAVKDKEDQARKKTNDDEVAVENVDVDIEWREAKGCGLKNTNSIFKTRDFIQLTIRVHTISTLVKFLSIASSSDITFLSISSFLSTNEKFSVTFPSRS